MPCTTTWMCSGAAPLDSASALCSDSMIFGTLSFGDSMVIQLHVDPGHGSLLLCRSPTLGGKPSRRPLRPTLPPAGARDSRAGVRFRSNAAMRSRRTPERRPSLRGRALFEPSACRRRRRREPVLRTARRAAEPPSGPSTRSRSRSGTWSSGTGASASKNWAPSSVRTACSTPRLITAQSPARASASRPRRSARARPP